jgi:hypothetical protein
MKRPLRLAPSHVILSLDEAYEMMRLYPSLWDGTKPVPSSWLCNRPFGFIATKVYTTNLRTCTPVPNLPHNRIPIDPTRRRHWPRRRIAKVITPSAGFMRPATVEFECGHEGTSWSRRLHAAQHPLSSLFGRCSECYYATVKHSTFGKEP